MLHIREATNADFEPLKFYATWYCPFAQRAWMALLHKGLAFDYIEVDPYRQSHWWLAISRQRAKVPVIDSPAAAESGSTTVIDSTRVIEFLEDLAPGIKAVIGREVPSGKLPMHVGAVVQNVGTIACIAEIFETGLPLIERVVTVTGPGVENPGNFIVPVGTKIRDLLAFCGGIKDNTSEVLSGGPMMGAAQPNLDAPVTKGVTGIVILTSKESRPRQVYPCISCGHCLDACPMFLNPSLMGKLAQTARYQEMVDQANLWDCMLCGACSYVCPSNIPLSQMFGMGKYQLGRLRRKEAAA